MIKPKQINLFLPNTKMQKLTGDYLNKQQIKTPKIQLVQSNLQTTLKPLMIRVIDFIRSMRTSCFSTNDMLGENSKLCLTN